MNVIVTENKKDYAGFLKVDSIKAVSELVGSIDVFVYHTSNESREDKVHYLSMIKGRVNQAIYIRDKNKVEQAVQMVIVGQGGRYIDDEFFLESSTELQNLIESVDEVTALAELGGTNVLGDFLNRYLKEGDASFSRSYLVVVKDAVNNLIADYKKKDLELIQMSETATELFSHSAELISNIREEEATLKEALEELSEAKESVAATASSCVRSGSSVFFFPTVTYPKEKNIIRIKAIGDVKYLVSFVMGLRIYLENIINVRPKLIVVIPVGDMYEKIYEDYPIVSQRTQRDNRNFYNNVVFVNYPNKDILTKLLDDTDFDTFIVVDTLRSSKGHILNSKGASVKYALGSEGMLKKFNLKAMDCFSSIVSIPRAMFTIPVFPSYPKERSQRERLYLRECGSMYNQLISLRK